MSDPSSWERMQARARVEYRNLLTVQASDRRWQMPFAAALASGLPLFIGAWFGRLDYGLVSSLGGLVFLYTPQTEMAQRMLTLMACAFGMIACYALGIISHFYPPAIILVLSFLTVVVTMACRFYRIGPPGNIFFIMAAAIGAYSPAAVLDVPLRVGLLSLGVVLASIIAFAYSVYMLVRRLQTPKPHEPPPPFDYVVFDALVIGVVVGVSLVMASVFGLDRPYWVPVSCLAVISGVSLRAVWTKQVHRIVGTMLGLLLAWVLLLLPHDPWLLAALMTVLTFIIEMAVVRHYGFAVIFITPLTIFLAEAASIGTAGGLTTAELIQARLFDIILGSVIGLIGGAGLYMPAIRNRLEPPLHRLWRRRGHA